MKKYILPIIVVVAFIVLLAYFYFNKFDFNNRISYNTQKLGTENLIDNLLALDRQKKNLFGNNREALRALLNK